MADQLTDQQIHDLYERVFRDTLVNGVFDTNDPNDPCVVEAVAEIRRVLAAPSIEAAAREIKHYDSPEDAATALINEARRMRGGSPEDGACGQEQTIDQLKARCLNESLLATAYRKARDRIAELEEMLHSVSLDLSQSKADEDAAQQQVKAMRELLSQCRSDIFQTARSNQCNLTGLDIVTPDDPPIPTRIGKCHVHQIGINESLQLVKRVEAALAQQDTQQQNGGDDAP